MSRPASSVPPHDAAASATPMHVARGDRPRITARAVATAC
jgi:hypothetical protein